MPSKVFLSNGIKVARLPEGGKGGGAGNNTFGEIAVSRCVTRVPCLLKAGFNVTSNFTFGEIGSDRGVGITGPRKRKSPRAPCPRATHGIVVEGYSSSSAGGGPNGLCGGNGMPN